LAIACAGLRDALRGLGAVDRDVDAIHKPGPRWSVRSRRLTSARR
jgi:hypothetical protein